MMYKEMHFLLQFHSLETNVIFQESKQLSEINQQEMILKMIETKQYIDQHRIKCDFEVYSENTMYIRMEDQELEDLFVKLKSQIDSATSESLLVVLTHETV